MGWTLRNGSYDLGTCPNGWGFGGTGKKSNSKKFENYGTTFGEKGDIIGCMIDLDSGEISFAKNGKHLGVAFRIPETKSNPIYPTLCTKNAPLTIKLHGDGKPAPFDCIWAADAASSQYLSDDSGNSGSSSGPSKAPKAIIIEPSRELAEQTYNWTVRFKRHLAGNEVKVMLIVGGANAKDQIRELERGVDIIVATPGRLEDLINGGHVLLNDCRFFIIDEIDDLLQKGQKNFIQTLHRSMPRQHADGTRLQMIVCSATLHNFDVKRLASDLMYFPTWVDLKGEDSVPETVHHVVIRVDPRKDLSWKEKRDNKLRTDGVHQKDALSFNQPTPETLSEAVKIIKGDLVVKVINKFRIDQGIIFCRTKIDCDNLEKHLNLVGGGANHVHAYSCVCLHADRRPDERSRNLQKFKDGGCRFLICTDVAARGIDISGVPFVIQVRNEVTTRFD